MARPHPILLAVARGEPVEQVDDCERLLASAVEHRMVGLLWSSVRSRPGLGPPEWRHAVATQDLFNQRRHAEIWRALEQLFDLTRSLDMAVGVVKGVSVEARWYHRVGERPSRDIDLWLSPTDLGRSEELVQAIQPDHPLVGRIQALVDARLLQSVELRFDGRFAVDLHFDLLKLGVPARHPELIWTHMVPYRSPNGVEILVPDPELSLVHLLIHLTKDRFRHLLGYVDIHRLVDRETLEWSTVEALARSQGLDRHLWLALEAVAEVVPLAQTPKRPPVQGVMGSIWRILWRPGVRLRGREGTLRFRRRQDWIGLTARGHFLEGIRYWVRRQLLPPRELVAYRHPDSRGYWRTVTLGRLRAAWRRRRAFGTPPRDGLWDRPTDTGASSEASPPWPPP